MQATKPILARSIETADDALVIHLADRDVHVTWQQCSPGLAEATDEQRHRAELSPGGYGIHWPLLDEDLTIGGLLRKCEDN